MNYFILLSEYLLIHNVILAILDIYYVLASHLNLKLPLNVIMPIVGLVF